MTVTPYIDLSEITLNETDTTRSVMQNVAVILSTRRGTVPLMRDFGLSQDYLDMPVSAARALAYSDIKETVEKFEPRAEVTGVTFVETTTDGKLIPQVEVKIIGT